jgi:hypothetical protein
MVERASTAPQPARSTGWARITAKNAAFLAVALGLWVALETGYLSPDRPTRDQWEQLQRFKRKATAELVYQSNFANESPGESQGGVGTWGRYNGATMATVQFDQAGVTVKYEGTAWIGASFRFKAFEPSRIYRVTIDREVRKEPGALIIRNRQMDLTRAMIPVGTGRFSTEFVAPRGRSDQVVLAFIPDNGNKPRGSMRITSLKIERLGE